MNTRKILSVNESVVLAKLENFLNIEGLIQLHSIFFVILKKKLETIKWVYCGRMVQLRLSTYQARSYNAERSFL